MMLMNKVDLARFQLYNLYLYEICENFFIILFNCVAADTWLYLDSCPIVSWYVQRFQTCCLDIYDLSIVLRIIVTIAVVHHSIPNLNYKIIFIQCGIELLLGITLI